jgi:hypothetical protein
MTHFRSFLTLSTLILLSGVVFSSCDEGPGTSPLPQNSFVLDSVSISPDEIIFQAQDGIHDTTLNVDVTLYLKESVSFSTEPVAILRLSNQQDQFTEAVLSAEDDGTYSGTLTFSQNTAQTNHFDLLVRAVDEMDQPTNILRKNFAVFGFTTTAPVLEGIFVPDTVFIPSGSDVQSFLLAARSYHPDGENLISRVNAILSDAEDQSLGEFRLYDDGSENQVDQGVSGDGVAGDSLYSRAFTLSSSNNPDSVTVKMYAADISGNYSDTLSTYFLIRR